MFTKELIKEIEYKLSLLARKDTSFELALELSKNDKVAIVQNNKNKIISIGDIITHLHLLGSTDFVNVTSKFNESYITLDLAILLIPFISRKIGQLITFLDKDGHWQIYQFKGTNKNQWNNITLWENVISTLLDSKLEADEEDITTKKRGDKYQLKFKDKEYNKEEFSGLGKVILRKNVSKVMDPTEDKPMFKNLLTQPMFKSEDTTYVIRYDYSLNGGAISLPKNSTLEFDGGSIVDGKIEGRNTRIINSTSNSFINIETTGTWNTELSEPIEGEIKTVNIVRDIIVNQDSINNIENNIGNIEEDIKDIDKDLSGLHEDFNKLPKVDEEDITVGEDDLIRFKDKEYSEKGYSGLGRVYLRKNIVDNRNILTQEMINKSNTIYIIQYDYDLNQKEITIPEGCMLEFNGGSLSNGVIVGNNTKIKAELQKIFDVTITLTGNWNVSEAYPEWYGVTNGEIDSTIKFQAILNSPFKNIVISQGVYNISDTLLISQGTSFTGKSSWDLVYYKSPVLFNFNPTSPKAMFESKEHTSVNYISGVTIKNFAVRGNGDNSTYCINTENLADSLISNLLIVRFNSAIMIKYWMNVTIDKCKFYQNKEYCIIASGQYTTTVTVSKCYLAESKWAVRIPYNSVVTLTFIDSIFESCSEGGCDIESHNNILFINHYVENINSNVFRIGYEESNSDIYPVGNITILGGNFGGTNFESYPSEYTLFNIKRNANLHIIGAYIGRFNHIFNFDNLLGLKGMIAIKDCNILQVSRYDLNQSGIISENNTYLGSKLSNTQLSAGGSEARKPTDLKDTDTGLTYFNTSLNKPSFWFGSMWRDADGFPSINRIGATSERPTGLNYTNLGTTYYDTTLEKLIIWIGERWVTTNGVTIGLLSGSTNSRPLLEMLDAGYSYYDQTLKQFIIWSGGEWISPNGNSLKNSGTSAERPNLSLNVGFIYKDTTLNKLIIWDGSKWINMDGTPLT